MWCFVHVRAQKQISVPWLVLLHCYGQRLLGATTVPTGPKRGLMQPVSNTISSSEIDGSRKAPCAFALLFCFYIVYSLSIIKALRDTNILQGRRVHIHLSKARSTRICSIHSRYNDCSLFMSSGSSSATLLSLKCNMFFEVRGLSHSVRVQQTEL